MIAPDWKRPLDAAARAALDFLEGLPERPVHATASLESLRTGMGGPLPEHATDAAEVTRALAEIADGGIVATPSGRFFGFVIGGTLPAALAADWLTGAWDQNAGLYAVAPAAAVAEEVALDWLRQLFRLPDHVSGGFVTGCQMANFTALAAARHEVLRRAGWDVERDGLLGAPRVRVLASEDRHATIDRALRYLGIGTRAIVDIEADDQGRMRIDALERALSEQPADAPLIVCAQAGNVNTGACDELGPICDLAHARNAWVHVDGAFGLWARVSDRLASLVDGVERADSWATDCHKWLNVPYDSGIALCARPEAHLASTGVRASYLIHAEHQERDPLEWTPEFSRRARGFTIYAAIRALGRSGIVEIIERTCGLARRLNEQLLAEPRFEVLADAHLNQVLFRAYTGDDAVDEDLNQRLVSRVQEDGTCWLSGTRWQARAAVRVSISNWSTDEADIDRLVSVLRRAVDELVGGAEADPGKG